MPAVAKIGRTPPSCKMPSLCETNRELANQGGMVASRTDRPVSFSPSCSEDTVMNCTVGLLLLLVIMLQWYLRTRLHGRVHDGFSRLQGRLVAYMMGYSYNTRAKPNHGGFFETLKPPSQDSLGQKHSQDVFNSFLSTFSSMCHSHKATPLHCPRLGAGPITGVMLLDMLATTAATKHGRPEHSSPHRSPSPPAIHGSFLSQMPLSVLNSVLRKQPAHSDTSLADAPKLPMKPDHEPHPSHSASRRASSRSLASNKEDKPKKRAPRPKTTYNLAQPPTANRPKLHIRPKVLLQLHQQVPSRRPKPVYEVIPFSLLAPRSTRRLARTFYSKTRDKLCPSDLLVVKAEEYGAKDDDGKTDDERWGSRDVVGIICPAKDEKGTSVRTEVLMNDGTCWEVTNLPNGGYEFGCTDEHGLSLKCRWVPKISPSRRTSNPSSGTENKKFNFSTISAGSRRHPVIATMTRTNIDVLDSYTMPSATSPPTPGYAPSGPETPLATPSSVSAASFLDFPPDRPTVKTDDTLRRFIVLSGIWVAFSEGWSLYSSLAKTTGPSPLVTSATFRQSCTPRTMSFVDSPRSVSPASTIDESRRTLPRLFKTGTQKLHRNSSFNTTSSPVSTQTSPASSPRIKTRGRRSNSTGNVDLNLRTGSNRKRFGLALEDQALPETEEERQIKRSVELLRIKELVLPSSPSEPKAPNAQPIEILETHAEDLRSSSPLSVYTRAAKTQSAFEPVTTAGLWDSGVTDRPGLKTRPTSLVILNGKKEKAKRKQEKFKSKEKNRNLELERHGPCRSGRLKECLRGLFCRGEKI
ncbi:hypothetical protein K504DRAFT_535583 [Pleomassaria siparia CBS 279.74]|uniref:Uncharacterized protein n=1 Tax=Pleomassaria siparia CBS 279.74 TaxID=1314801 RepID=A0A6G1K3R7_9PLEO|nr:hypothetical protein K504DRAFT_535583 [Pleomassaria siparia CBS 279.74]